MLFLGLFRGNLEVIDSSLKTIFVIHLLLKKRDDSLLLLQMFLKLRNPALGLIEFLLETGPIVGQGQFCLDVLEGRLEGLDAGTQL
jgi:hypothetical protein